MAEGGGEQEAAKPLALMVGAHIEQAQVTIVTEGDEAEHGAGLLQHPAVVLTQLADKAGMMGTEGPLRYLRLAVVLGAALAHRLLEQGDEGGDMRLAQRDYLGLLRHGAAHSVGACGRLALGRPATTRS